MASGSDVYNAKGSLAVRGGAYTIYKLDALVKAGVDVARLPFSLRVLLENALRNCDGRLVTKENVDSLAHWK
ncbi:MAG: hypothetical protein ACRDD1_10025, partial [Planctomycetia bacterium]